MSEKYKLLGAWGEKGTSYFLDRDVVNRNYYLFKVSDYGKTKSGRVRILSDQAAKLVRVKEKKGKKLAEKIFRERSNTIFGGHKDEQ